MDFSSQNNLNVYHWQNTLRLRFHCAIVNSHRLKHRDLMSSSTVYLQISAICLVDVVLLLLKARCRAHNGIKVS